MTNTNKVVHTPWELFGVEHGPGWSWLTVALMQQALNDNATVVQVKEKFGGLRFYCNETSEELDRLIRAAEEMSYQHCEICGSPGKHRTSGWMITACDKHYTGA